MLLVVATLLASCSVLDGGSDGAAGGDPADVGTTAIPSTGAVAPTTTAPAATTTTAPPIDLRTADLVRRRYRISCPGGEVEVDAAAATATGADGAPIAYSGFVPRFADLTGDGKVEALLPATCARAGDLGTAVDSVVVVIVGPVGPAQMGGPVVGREPLVVGRSIAVARPVPAPGEPPCCTATVRWEAVSFVEGAWVPHVGGAPVTEGDPAVPEGLGSLSIGAPYGELAIATGQPIEVTDILSSGGACTSVGFPGGLPFVVGWGGDGTLQSIVIGDPRVLTVEGLGIGIAEVDVAAVHEGELEAYDLAPGVRELVHVPADFPELVTSFRVEAGLVTRMVVGRQGWAEGGGGCAGG